MRRVGVSGGPARPTPRPLHVPRSQSSTWGANFPKVLDGLAVVAGIDEQPTMVVLGPDVNVITDPVLLDARLRDLPRVTKEFVNTALKKKQLPSLDENPSFRWTAPPPPTAPRAVPTVCGAPG